MRLEAIKSIHYRINGEVGTPEVQIVGVHFFQYWVQRAILDDELANWRPGALRVYGTIFCDDLAGMEATAALATYDTQGAAELIVRYWYQKAAKKKTFHHVVFGTGAGSYASTPQSPTGQDLRPRISFQCNIDDDDTVADAITNADGH